MVVEMKNKIGKEKLFSSFFGFPSLINKMKENAQ